jgi:uncharacterized protein VirK/YbjX
LWKAIKWRAILAARRVKFIVRALTNYSLLKPIIDARPGGALGKAIKARPEIIGAVLWPYQCSAWDVRTRLSRIRAHYDAVEAAGGLLDFPANATLTLLDLAEIKQGLRVAIDQPRWFMREGQLVINLFMAETRLYSLAFSLLQEANGQFVAVVGAIQGRGRNLLQDANFVATIQGRGRDLEIARDEYRRLTKAAHGMRPRDLLFEVFRMFCARTGVAKIVAVADEFRLYRHPYFGKEPKAFWVDYNEIWADRGGTRTSAMFYSLDAYRKPRDLAEIRANKRAMYRQRYQMLDSLNEQLTKNLLLLCESRKDEALGEYAAFYQPERRMERDGDQAMH